MTLKETLLADLKTAMKEKDTIKKNVVTLIRAAILQYEKDNQKELDEAGIIDVIARQVKQRRDSLADFERAARTDLIEQTNREIELLTAYLPEQLSDEELTEIVREAMTRLNITEKKQLGKLMGDVLPRVAGRADGKRVNMTASKFLS